VRQQLPPVGKGVVAEVIVPKRSGAPAPAPSPGGILALTVVGGVAVWVFFATISPVERRRSR